MRHRVAKRHFNRDTNARKALLAGLMRELVVSGKITTTEAKAKEVARLFDKQLSKAKRGTLADRRKLHQMFGKRDVVNTLVDRIAPTVADRTSGFTTRSVIGKRRGDNALLVQVALVVAPESTATLKAPASAKKQPAAKSSKAKSSTKASSTAKSSQAKKTSVAPKKQIAKPLAKPAKAAAKKK